MSLNAGQLTASGEFVDADCMARHMDEAMLELSGPPPDPDDSGKRGRL